MGEEQRQEPIEIVGPRSGQSQFLEKRLEVFLRRLLAMKTDDIMKGRPLAT